MTTTRALAAYEEGLELARAAGDRTHEAMLVGNLSFIAEHRGDYEEAWRLCVEAVRLSWALGRRLVLAATMAQMGVRASVSDVPSAEPC